LIGAVLGAAAVAALAVPAGAVAGTRPAERGSGHQTHATVTESFELQGTNGYSISLSLDDRRQLTVSAESEIRGSHATRGVVYTLPAPQSSRSADIKARIGNLGQVDVHFVPESTHETAPVLPNCKGGGKNVVARGHFVGLISFRGEQGYTHVRSHRAVGTITTEPARTCTLPKEPAQNKAATEKELAELEEIKEVQLNAALAHGKVRFQANQVQLKVKGRLRTVSSFSAIGIRRLGMISEVALSLALIEKGSLFATPEPLFPTREATIAPPAPFSGTATFRRDPGQSANWSGDLSVELPGFGTVPLAGDGSHASMCQAPACRL
jgi:hypothetical protein